MKRRHGEPRHAHHALTHLNPLPNVTLAQESERRRTFDIRETVHEVVDMNLVNPAMIQGLAGRIKVSSVLGEGTVFEITLPKVAPQVVM